MKKLLLLLATGVIATASNGQQALKSIVFPQNDRQLASQPKRTLDLSNHLNTGANNRTTSGGAASGWFDYADSVFAPNITLYGGAGDALNASSMYMWSDTTAIFGYDNAGTPSAIGYGIPQYGYDYNVSAGLLCDPFASDWPVSPLARPTITSTTAYTIDSVIIVGIYGRPNGAAYNDHLNLSFITGSTVTTGDNIALARFTDPTLLGWYGLSSPDSALWTPLVAYDSLANQVTSMGGPAPITYSESLGAADTSLTFWKAFAYPVNVPVAAGNLAVMTFSFQTGSTYPALGDSITSANGTTFYYGSFQPQVDYMASTSAVDFPPYRGPEPGPTPVTGDFTTGLFKSLGSLDGGWAGYYVPNWASSSTNPTSGATQGYYQQYPNVMFHIKCPTCVLETPKVTIATEVNVYPNPASDVVTVNFNLATASNVSVTLSNMMGQVVATQNMASTSNGKVEFSTTALPAGVYFYTFNANGERTTGRVVVAH